MSEQQCVGTTGKGTRCTRKTVEGTSYCKLHNPEKPKEQSIFEKSLNPMQELKPQLFDSSKNLGIDDYDVLFLRGDEYKEKREKIIKYLLSGTPLDNLMKIASPGWETSSVYLVYGAYNTGKTQLCNTMAVLNDFDVIWIDGGEDTFRPERIMEVAKLRGKDPQQTINRIHIAHAINATHLEAICNKIPALFMDLVEREDDKIHRTIKKDVLQTGQIGLVILDSIAPTFRTQYQGREELFNRQRGLLNVIMCLRRVSQWFNCVVIVTDQIISDPSNTYAYGGPWISQKPVGGPTVTHNFDFQLRFRPSKGNIRVATIMDSSNTPMGEIEFQITAKGIEPIPQKRESLNNSSQI